MPNIKVPSTFQLGGLDFRVEREDEISDDPNLLGQIVYRKGLVNIKNGLTPEYEPLVFYHELVHGILMTMNHELEADEQFVDVFASLLVQALKTSDCKKR